MCSIERRLSLGSSSAAVCLLRRADEPIQERLQGVWGSAVNYPRDPQFRPRFVFKAAASSPDMDLSKKFLADHAILVSDVGPLQDSRS
jgi:hypothetical protein